MMFDTLQSKYADGICLSQQFGNGNIACTVGWMLNTYGEGLGNKDTQAKVKRFSSTKSS